MYAFTKVLDGHRLVLVKEQDSFEARERTLFTVVLVGFVLTVPGALALGWQVARRVMVPVSQLAKAGADAGRSSNALTATSNGLRR